MMYRTSDDGRRTTDDILHSAYYVSRFTFHVLRNTLTAFFLLSAILVLAGCGDKMSWQVMAQQPRYEPYEPSEFFPDNQSARQPVPNTVARGYLREDTQFYSGQAQGQAG